MIKVDKNRGGRDSPTKMAKFKSKKGKSMKKIIKYLVFGFAALGFGIVVIVFVGYICYINGVFDGLSYDEIFEEVSSSTEEWCHTGKFNEKGKFIPASELQYEENGLIGVCEYIQLSENWYGDYALPYYFDFKDITDYCLNYELKQECKQGKESESYTGLLRLIVGDDIKNARGWIDNKYKIVRIVESAEYCEDKRGKGFYKKREVFKLKKGQPKETIHYQNPLYETKYDNTHRY